MEDLPTWLQTYDELVKVAKTPNVAGRSDMRVYKEMALELDQILSQRPLHISHGYSSSQNCYMLAWRAKDVTNTLFIRVKYFDDIELSLSIAIDDFASIPKGFITLKKDQLYGWLNQVVDEIFLQAI